MTCIESGRPRSGIWLVVMALLCTAVLVPYADAAPIAAEAYSRFPAIQTAALSADGKRIAVLRNEGSVSRIRILEVDTGKLLHTVESLQVPGALRRDRIVDLNWVDEHHVGYLLVSTIPYDDIQAPSIIVRPWDAGDFERMTVLDVTTGRSELVHHGALANEFREITSLVGPIAGDVGARRAALGFRPRCRALSAIFNSGWRRNRSVCWC